MSPTNSLCNRCSCTLECLVAALQPLHHRVVGGHDLELAARIKSDKQHNMRPRVNAGGLRIPTSSTFNAVIQNTSRCAGAKQIIHCWSDTEIYIRAHIPKFIQCNLSRLQHLILQPSIDPCHQYHNPNMHTPSTL